MLQVHDREKFNDDGTPRRKYEIEETAPGRLGLRVAFGMALGSAVAFIKDVLAATPSQAQSSTESEAPDVASKSRGPVDDTPIASNWEASEPAEEDRGNDVSTAPLSRSASRPAGAVSQAVGERHSLAKQSNDISGLGGLERSPVDESGPAVQSGNAFDQAGSSGSADALASQGDVDPDEDDDTPVIPPPAPTTNRRPMSTGLVSLGTILLNAHFALALADLLSKSDDPDGDRLAVKALTVSSGTLTLNEDGSWHYLPVYDDARPVVFRYQVSDGELDTWQEAVLTVVVPDMTFIDGTADSESLLGTVGADKINAGAGDDTVIARDGDDIILGGAGADRIEAGDGNDVVWAGAGDDFVLGGRGDDALYGEDGDDALHGEGGNDVLDGGRGNDVLHGGDGNDFLIGGDGADQIADGAGADVVDAGAGADTIYAASGDDQIDGGSGTDTFVATTKSAVQVDLVAGTASGIEIGHDRITDIENVVTGSGDDAIVGNAAANTIVTGDGNDVVNAGSGNNVVDTGSGNDIVNAEAGDDAVNVGSGNNVVDVGSGNDTVEAGSGNDIIKAGSGNNVVDAGSGNDIVNAEAGDDAVNVGSGNNVVDVGSGNDTVEAGSGNDVVKAGSGNNVVDVGSGNDTVEAGAGNDVVDAGSGEDVVNAGSGNDTVEAGLGNDIVEAGSGEDVVNAGSGNDTVDLGSGDDVALISADNAHDTFDAGAGSEDLLDVGPVSDAPTLVAIINLVEGVLDFGDGEQDSIRNFENVRILGMDANVIGDREANEITTGAGSDTVNAGAGADAVVTGDGDDIICVIADGADDRFDGGNDKDVLDLSTVSENVVVDLEAGEIRIANETDSIRQVEAIHAGSGHDQLIADGQQNDLWGGLGNDAFIFRSARAAGNGEGRRDRIWDFEAGDSIDINDLFNERDLNGLVSSDLRFTLLIGEDRVFTQAGQLRVNSIYDEFEGAPRRLILDGNLDEIDDTDFQIELSGDADAIMDFLNTAYGRTDS